jgi:hypothetical protein
MYAHEPARPLPAGHWDLTVDWGASGGIDHLERVAFTGDTISLYELFPFTSEYNVSYGGSRIVTRYGISDWLSVGLRNGLIDMTVYGVTYGKWKLFASTFIDINLINQNRDTLNFSTELWASPLFSFPTSNWMADGTCTSFNTISYNHLFLDTVSAKQTPIKVFGYTEAKYIVTWVNQAYGADYYNKDIIFANFTQAERDAITFNLGAGHRIALTVGCEVDIGRALLNLGFNIPIYRFWYSPAFNVWGSMWNLDDIGLNGLELSWCFRF